MSIGESTQELKPRNRCRSFSLLVRAELPYYCQGFFRPTRDIRRSIVIKPPPDPTRSPSNASAAAHSLDAVAGEVYPAVCRPKRRRPNALRLDQDRRRHPRKHRAAFSANFSIRTLGQLDPAGLVLWVADARPGKRSAAIERPIWVLDSRTHLGWQVVDTYKSFQLVPKAP
jgi:hypothetical protein